MSEPRPIKISTWPVFFGLVLVALAVCGSTALLTVEMRTTASVGRYIPVLADHLALVDSRTGETHILKDEKTESKAGVWVPLMPALGPNDDRPEWLKLLED